MVQRLHSPQGIVSMQGVNPNQNVVYYCPTQPSKGDSFNGKTLLTIAAVAGGLIFRKNIKNFLKNHLPEKAVSFIQNHITKPLRKFSVENSENFFVKGYKWTTGKYVRFEDWVKGLFTK